MSRVPEITPAMVNVGVDAYLALDREFDPIERIVTDVFQVMAEASPVSQTISPREDYLERIRAIRRPYFASAGFRRELAEARDLGLLSDALRDIGVQVLDASRG